jgi:hypothetical protein
MRASSCVYFSGLALKGMAQASRSLNPALSSRRAVVS